MEGKPPRLTAASHRSPPFQEGVKAQGQCAENASQPGRRREEGVGRDPSAEQTSMEAHVGPHRPLVEPLVANSLARPLVDRGAGPLASEVGSCPERQSQAV